jgi:exodeoxyribonuclease VIII
MRTEYNRWNAVSQSQLKVLDESPRRFQATYITQTLLREETDDMLFGSVVHTMVLQPDCVDKYVTVIPEEVLTSNGHRRGNAWNAFLAANQDKFLVKQDVYDRALRISRRVKQHPFWELVQGWKQHVEVPIWWTDDETGVNCKGIPDIVCSNNWIIDLKTTKDISGFVEGREKFTSKKIYDFGYHIQAAFYLEGASKWYDSVKNRFALVVVETTEPHRVYAIEIGEPSIFAGKLKVHALLEEYERRVKSCDWSEEGERSLLQVNVPSWAM